MLRPGEVYAISLSDPSGSGTGILQLSFLTEMDQVVGRYIVTLDTLLYSTCGIDLSISLSVYDLLQLTLFLLGLCLHLQWKVMERERRR